jgi:methylmalonyl-CoA mutase cobalamin-binding subunit
MSQVVERAIKEKVRVFVLASFASAGVAQLRLMTSRLRSRDRHMYIVVARWCAGEDDVDVADAFRTAGADVVVTTIAEARDAIIRSLNMPHQRHAEAVGALPDGAPTSAAL